MSPTLATALVGGVAGVIVAAIGFLGVRAQARAGREGAKATADSGAADRALKAWETLLEPYRAEVSQLRSDLDTERSQRREETAHLRSQLGRLVTHVRPILHWLDAGAVPPPPPIHVELRALIEGDD